MVQKRKNTNDTRANKLEGSYAQIIEQVQVTQCAVEDLTIRLHAEGRPITRLRTVSGQLQEIIKILKPYV